MRVLVTGGGGFLGQALCRGLVERGHDVASFNRGHYAELDALGVRQIAGDLADHDAVTAALAGRDAVFHNAAKAGAWGSYDSYHRANVLGTQHVLDACRVLGIGRLVYTSTPSVTHRATHPVEGGTAETVPYGEGFKAPYATTKTIAEKAVLAANDATLATVALRPRLIWGPGDNNILPRLIAVDKHIPFAAAYAVGVLCEGLWHALPLQGEPPMTRFLAEQLATTHWYSMEPARRDFGYVPKVSVAEGLARLRAALQ